LVDGRERGANAAGPSLARIPPSTRHPVTRTLLTDETMDFFPVSITPIYVRTHTHARGGGETAKHTT